MDHRVLFGSVFVLSQLHSLLISILHTRFEDTGHGRNFGRNSNCKDVGKVSWIQVFIFAQHCPNCEDYPFNFTVGSCVVRGACHVIKIVLSGKQLKGVGTE